MLSPLDLENRKIVTKKRKYDKIQMDEYLNLVFENYKELYKENQELKEKMKTLSDGIQYYRSIETTMQKALVLAEKTSKETKDAAILKAEAIEKDATDKAEQIINEAAQEYERIRDKCIQLVQQFNQYKTQLQKVTTTQLELITSDTFDVDSPDLEEIEPVEFKHEASTTASQTESDSVLSGSGKTPVEPPMEQTVEHTVESPVNSTSGSEQTPLTFTDDVTETASQENSQTPDLALSGETTVLPDIKKEKSESASGPNVDDEETLSILTADTIDLRDSIKQVQKEEEKALQQQSAPQSSKAKEQPQSSVTYKDVTVMEPVQAKTVKPMEVEFKKPKKEPMQILEPTEKKDDSPTLDALLQSMNMGGKNKKKKGEEDDPFEFLGSVDDF